MAIQKRPTTTGGPDSGVVPPLAAQGQSLAELYQQRMQERLNAQHGAVDLTGDSPEQTLQDVGGMIGVPPELIQGRSGVPNPFEGVPLPEGAASSYYPGSPFGGVQQLQPAVDPNTGRQLSADNGLGMLEPVTEEDFAIQQGKIQEMQRNFQQGFEQLAVNDTQGAADTFMKDVNMAAASELMPQRITDKFSLGERAIKNSADRVAGPLEYMIMFGREALLSDNSEISALDYESRVPVGAKVGLLENIPEQEMTKVADATSISLFKALSQVQRLKTKEKGNAPEETGDFLEDAMPYDDVVSSVDHFLGNVLGNLGIKVSPRGRRELAAGGVHALISNGDLVLHNDENGRISFRKTPKMAKMADELALTAEIVAGDSLRMRSATAPTIGGSHIGKSPKTTKNSWEDETVNTTAADATKTIWGSNPYMFLSRDLLRKEKELGLVFSKEFLKDHPDGYYSTHPLADKHGVGRKAYRKSFENVRKPADYDKNDPSKVAAHEAKAKAAAKKIIQQKVAAMNFDMENIKKSPGLRYATLTHSTINQRFFIDNFDLDYMGSKTVIRDVLNFGHRDEVAATDLFNPEQIQRLQALARANLLNKNGMDRHKFLMGLPRGDLGALGVMFNTVINYFTVIDPSRKDILKENEATVIGLYRPEMANKLADLGAKYNAWLDDVDGQLDHTEIMKFMATVEPGESMANMALWDDLYQLQRDNKNPELARKHRRLTHTSVNDGNQNGIFIQALLFGNANAARRLGRYKGVDEKLAQADMREYAFNIFTDNLDEYYSKGISEGDELKRKSWASFFEKIAEREGGDFTKIAKTFFKAPLMQTSYGKDASMFGEHVWELLDSYRDIFDETLGSVYKDVGTAAGSAAQAMESTLREIIDSEGTGKLKGIGRIAAMLGEDIRYKGIDGDTVVIGPVGMDVVKLDDKYAAAEQVEPGIFIKRPAYDTIDVTSGDGQLEQSYNRLERKIIPHAAKANAMYWSEINNKWSSFTNYLGTQLSRQMAVMPVQAIDGAWVKMTTIAVNKDQKIPVPMYWIHDSVVSSGGGALVYRNAYNNITVPRSFGKISKFGKDITRAYNQLKERAYSKIDQMDYVSIGSQGDFPAVGAFFDEVYDRYKEGSSYKEAWLARKGNTEDKWQKKQQEADDLLDRAKQLGWVPQGTIPESQRQYLAIKPNAMKKLVELAEVEKGVDPVLLNSWADAFESKVKDTAKFLMKSANPAMGGIAQMTTGGGNTPLDKLPEQPKTEPRKEKETIGQEVPKLSDRFIPDMDSEVPF